MFNIGLIDSLKVRIRKSKIKVLDKRLTTEFLKYYPNIELLDETVNNCEPLTIIINGITYRFYFKAFITEKKTAEEYLVLQISAKMLKERYFDGITIQNFKRIVDDINALKIVKLDYETFLDGLVSDIDICINQLIDEKSLRTAFSLLLNHPKPSKKPLLHHITKTHHIKGTINLGLDFNKREKATNTTPYCKIYHKGIELQTKSSTFYEAYLQPMKAAVLDNLVRYEFTIKAAKHKKYLCEAGLNADFKTMRELLQATETDLLNIAKSGLPHYVEQSTTLKNIKDLSPMDLVLSYYIASLIDKGYSEEQLMDFQNLINCPVTKSRTKSKIKNLIANVTEKNKPMKQKLQQNGIAKEFLFNLGLTENVPF